MGEEALAVAGTDSAFGSGLKENYSVAGGSRRSISHSHTRTLRLWQPATFLAFHSDCRNDYVLVLVLIVNAVTMNPPGTVLDLASSLPRQLKPLAPPQFPPQPRVPAFLNKLHA